MLNAFFTGKPSLQESQAPEAYRNVWSKEYLPMDEDYVRQPNKWGIGKSMGHDGLH